MYYYKLTNDTEFIGIGSTYDMRKYQEKHQIILSCTDDEAQYIQVGEKLYRDNWMRSVPENKYAHTNVTIINIEKEEYDALYKLIESGEDVPVDEEIVQEDPIVNDGFGYVEVTVEFAKEKKIKEMDTACNQAITNGFDVMLSDGESHHFSLTTQDQLNLITLATLAASGEMNIPLHADGEPCKFYSAEDVLAISSAATNHKTYHVSYFNSLKLYVKSMDSVEEIAAVEYGMEIPEEHQSEVLQAIVSSID